MKKYFYYLASYRHSKGYGVSTFISESKHFHIGSALDSWSHIDDPIILHFQKISKEEYESYSDRKKA